MIAAVVISLRSSATRRSALPSVRARSWTARERRSCWRIRRPPSCSSPVASTCFGERAAKAPRAAAGLARRRERAAAGRRRGAGRRPRDERSPTALRACSRRGLPHRPLRASSRLARRGRGPQGGRPQAQGRFHRVQPRNGASGMRSRLSSRGRGRRTTATTDKVKAEKTRAGREGSDVQNPSQRSPAGLSCGAGEAEARTGRRRRVAFPQSPSSLSRGWQLAPALEYRARRRERCRTRPASEAIHQETPEEETGRRAIPRRAHPSRPRLARLGPGRGAGEGPRPCHLVTARAAQSAAAQWARDVAAMAPVVPACSLRQLPAASASSP
jgi:hypothetical protein